MTNKQNLALSLALLAGIGGLACQQTADKREMPGNQVKTNSEQAAPAIETTAEAFGKEWLSDRATADTKYQGKVISFTDEVWVAQQIGDEIFITFEAVPFDLKAGGAKIECASALTRDAKMIVEGFRLNEVAANYSTKKDAKPAQIKAVVKGTYSRSAPPDRLDGFIVLKPCEVSVY